MITDLITPKEVRKILALPPKGLRTWRVVQGQRVSVSLIARYHALFAGRSMR